MSHISGQLDSHTQPSLFRFEKCQISDLVGVNKWSIVLTTAAGSFFKSRPVTASVR
jgi:hypothetical protein